MEAARELRMLDELAELGMGIARAVHDARMQAEAGADLIGLANAFHDVSRGVRQSIALALRIRSGSFRGEYTPQRPAKAEAEAEPAERPEREPPERADWNEYERPDWEMPARVEAHEAFETDLDRGVIRIRRDYAKGLAALAPAARPTIRAGLMTGSAALRLVDSS